MALESDRPRYLDMQNMTRLLILPIMLSAVAGFSPSAVAGRVILARTPEEGIQPQAAVDLRGVVHLIYYKGDPRGGDIFYVRQSPGAVGFSEPIRVNRQAGSATAMGTIRGAQLAVGKAGRVHVVWNGMGQGAAPVLIGHKNAAPLWYTRLNDQGSAFEPERNLITYAAGLDGGSSIAADEQGHVYAFWQAPRPGDAPDETGRALFLARSNDEGKTFGPETRVLASPTGACPCCGMRAFADHSGAVYVLFRGANGGVNRDELLLVSAKPGLDFKVAGAYPWRTATCPMSSAFLSGDPRGAVAAWETAGQVYYATVNPKGPRVSAPTCPTGETVRKHPAAVVNDRGETLLVWTEGTGWARGGRVAWQIFGSSGKPASERGSVEGLPAWSLATAFARPGGEFVIVY